MTLSLPLSSYIPLQDNCYYTEYGKLMLVSFLFLNFTRLSYHFTMPGLAGAMRLQEKKKQTAG